MTLQHFEESRGEAVLTSFLAAFPAKTSAQPEKEPELTVSDPACGWKWPESSVKYDPLSCSWKTRQCSLLGGLVEFSETWPRWGSMRNGECWEQPMWGLRTSESESGWLPTPRASVWKNRRWWAQHYKKEPKGNLEELPAFMATEFQHLAGKEINPAWLDWVMGFPPGWTGLKPLETAKFPNAPQPRLSKAVGD
jgi:hypothetical protein